MQTFEELFDLAKGLREAALTGAQSSIVKTLDALNDAASRVARSFSGSWLGYHSRIYYDGFESPPPGAHFSQEWGLKHFGYSTDLGSHGDWREYDPQDVRKHIYKLAKQPDITNAREAASKAIIVFDHAKSEILSILETELADKPDAFLTRLKSDLEQIEPMSKDDVAQRWSPPGQVITRDMLASGQKEMVPPHIDVLADIAAIRHSFDICGRAGDISAKAASHLERKRRTKIAAARVGTNVFIGHGRSSVWRELKDFIQERLQLPWDEFNRVPVAGVTNIARLSEMLDAAGSRQQVCYDEITGNLARNAHKEFAKILSPQEADESPWSVLKSFNHVFAIFDSSLADPGRDIAHEIPVTRRKVGDDETAKR